TREKAFITFLLTQGKSNISGFGFSNLAYSTRQAELQKLKENTTTPAVEEEANGSWATIALIIAAIIIGTGFIVNIIFGFTKNGLPEKTEDNLNHEPQGSIDESSVAAPEGLFFDKSHTWTFLEKDGKVRMGLDDFMQQITGPITRIKFRKSGEHIRKGEPIVTIIQNGKQLSLNAPVSGTIDTINKTLEENVASINSAPFNEGWLYLIAPDNWQQETPFLKMATEYKAWMKGEVARLKDFLAYSLNINNTNLAQVALQDGGAVKKHVLKDLPPEVWEDFQEKFLERIK
ncbi:MAG TPA: glycine cleavage system protein H, partial [Bacteroidales bacterium]|nr:glycine cleavage system protein H [Bacteroidales bacterium]